MKKSTLLLFSILGMLFGLNAQIATFDEEAIKADFIYNMNLYGDAFVGPVLESYSSSQVASNHITAKVLQPFAVSFGIQASGTQVKSQDLKFNFNEVPFTDNFYLTNPNKPELPTILGGSTTAEMIYRIEGQTIAGPIATVSFEEKISALDGLVTPGNMIPAGAFHLAVGLPMKTEVFLRALPTLDFNGVENYMVGGGVKHQVSQYFFEEESPIHVALAGFYSKSDFSFVPETSLEGENQEISFEDRTYSFETIFSYDKDYYSFFGLLGYYGGTSEFGVNGTYEYTVEGSSLNPPQQGSQRAFSITNPVSLSRTTGGVQAAVGFSVKLKSIAALSAAYHIAKNNSIAVNLRFAINNGDRD